VQVRIAFGDDIGRRMLGDAVFAGVLPHPCLVCLLLQGELLEYIENYLCTLSELVILSRGVGNAR
jgi:hypothetical protein